VVLSVAVSGTSAILGVEDGHGDRKVVAPQKPLRGSDPPLSPLRLGRQPNNCSNPAVGWAGTQVGNDF
jgi:hypothetical protein